MAVEEVVPGAALNLSLNMSPPEKFCFTRPESWTQWKKRFERYLIVSGLSNRTDDEKINVLLYLMGEESEEILLQFAEVPTNYALTVRAFDKYFIPKKNVIFERYKFNSRTQKEGESVDSFITALHGLAEYCEYGALKEELIRDRIVVGMSDTKTSETIQLRGEVQLAEVVMMARRAENQQKQNQVLRLENKTIAAVSSNKWQMSKQQSNSKVNANPSTPNSKGVCGYCGRHMHERDKCPAKEAKCNLCGKKGHYSRVCRKKKEVKSITVESSNGNEANELLLGSIWKGGINKQWYANVFVKELKKSVPFLVDTGADINCLPLDLLNNSQKVEQCTEVVSGPDDSKLDLVGKTKLMLKFKEISAVSEVYVFRNLKVPILGRTGLSQLKLIQFSQGHLVGHVSQLENLNIETIAVQYPGIFNGLGVYKDEIRINISSDAEPFVQSVPRVVPIALRKPLEKEIDRLLKLGVIVPVEEHTSWVAPIVVVPKGNDIRLCCDYTRLNKSVLRPHFPIPKVESTLARLKDSKFFSKLDASSGFYQIKLDKESQRLTTFITPFGRYMFTRLPFGISCAPEFFSQKFTSILSDIKEGVVIHIDDILVHAATREDHDEKLKEVLKRIHDAGMSLNRGKCEIGVKEVKYLGYVVSEKGLTIDPSRVEAIVNMPSPTNKKEVLQILGMINFVDKFIPQKSHLLEPLTALLRKDVEFVWEITQQKALDEAKHILTKAPNLSFFDLEKQIIVSADASSFGLGAALFQVNSEGVREVVAFASRTLTKTESRYAQIEKEALGLTWACEKFKEYIMGLNVVLETDHKPLLQILQTKNLDELTPRLQRFRIRLMRYTYSVKYTKGTELLVADALSRNPIKLQPTDEELGAEIEAHVNQVIRVLPCKDKYLLKIAETQSNDSVCRKLIEYYHLGWPEKSKLPDELLPYYQYRNDFSQAEGFLLKGTRLVIPSSLQLEIINFIHNGHQGIVKCRARANQSVWWLGLATQIENLVRNCPNCVEERVNKKESFVKDAFPDRPWQKIALDLFKCKNWFLIITDYYSRFIEIFQLDNDFSSKKVINSLLSVIGRFGIPDTVCTDGGPQFRWEFQEFLKEFNINHRVSSPHYAQSNGAVEAAVKVAKNLIKKNGLETKQLQLALLAYRSTPLECGFSPSELLLARKIKTFVPLLPSKLNKIIDTSSVKVTQKKGKEKQERNYNKRHRVKDLSELGENDSVWVTDLRQYGKIVKKTDEPRSYIVKTDSGTYRRNRWHLISAPYVPYKKEFSLINPENVENSNNTNVPATTSTEPEIVDLGAESSIINVENPIVNVENRDETTFVQESNDSGFVPRRSQRITSQPAWMRDYNV
jgi:transposase InsO family protein